MKRRSFVRSSLLTGTSLGATPFLYGNKIFENSVDQDFTLNFAPHFGMFRHHSGDDLVDQLNFMADRGFRALEDNRMKHRSIKDQNRIAKAMEKRGMRMGVFVAHTINWKEPYLTTGKKVARENFLNEIRESVDIAKRVNAKWMTVVPGPVELRLEIGYQTAHVVESLKRACDILEPHDLVMVLEPLNYMDHPLLFLNKAAQAFNICRAVDSPACKILFDIYHQQIQEGNIISNIEASWDEIAYFQIGDNPGRKEPTTGELNYANIFKYIYDRKFDGILGMEHGNSQDGKMGEQKVIDAYRNVDVQL